MAKKQHCVDYDICRINSLFLESVIKELMQEWEPKVEVYTGESFEMIFNLA